MTTEQWDKSISFLGALILHILLLVLIIYFSIEQKEQRHKLVAPENIVQAVAIDENQLRAAQRQKELERQKAEQERLEAKRKAEKIRADKRRKADAKRKAEAAEKKRKADAKRKAEAAEKRRQAEDEERARQLAEEKRKTQEAARYQAEKLNKIRTIIARIQVQVLQNWIRPRGYYKGLSCVIEIHLKAGGTVKTAKIISSSGNSIFDTSAIKAVYDTSPLPIPYDIFDEFRVFNFTFKP